MYNPLPTPPIHPTRRSVAFTLFYMCGPSFCSRLVVEKHFETFTTFFHQLPRRECAESETGQDGKEGVTTFFSPEVYVVGGANGILYVDIDMFMFTHRKVSEWSLLIEFITPV